MRAQWIATDTDWPALGAVGTAQPAGGFDDLDSAEQGAYLFMPDGETDGAYCDPQRDIRVLAS